MGLGDWFFNPGWLSGDPGMGLTSGALGADSMVSEDQLWGSIGDKIDYDRNPYETDLGNFQFDPQMNAYLKTKLRDLMAGRGGVPQQQMARAMERAKAGAGAMYSNQGGMNAGTSRRMAGNQFGQAQMQAAMANEAIKAKQQMAAEQMMKQLLAQEHKARLERQKIEQDQFWKEENKMFDREDEWAKRKEQNNRGALGAVAGFGSQYLASKAMK